MTIPLNVPTAAESKNWFSFEILPNTIFLLCTTSGVCCLNFWEKTYKACNWASCPISPLNVPFIPMVVSFLEHQKSFSIEHNEMAKKEYGTGRGTHSIVTRDSLLQPIPSHGTAHGSLDCPQFGGVFCHSLIKDRRAAAAIIPIGSTDS